MSYIFFGTPTPPGVRIDPDSRKMFIYSSYQQSMILWSHKPSFVLQKWEWIIFLIFMFIAAWGILFWAKSIWIMTNKNQSIF